MNTTTIGLPPDPGGVVVAGAVVGGGAVVDACEPEPVQALHSAATSAHASQIRGCTTAA